MREREDDRAIESDEQETTGRYDKYIDKLLDLLGLF